jgi:hypothetical protein
MPSRTEATRAKAALCATGRLTPLRPFSTPPFFSPCLANKRRKVAISLISSISKGVAGVAIL